MHQLQLDEFGHSIGIDQAPRTIGFPGREPDHITDAVDAFSNSVDPAKAERRIHGLRPRKTWFSGTFFIEPHPQFLRFRMVLIQP